jgi:hypothetical protein
VCEYIYECVDTTGAVPRACRERERLTFGGTKDKEWPPKGGAKRQGETDARASRVSKREKIEKIEEKGWGQ